MLLLAPAVSKGNWLTAADAVTTASSSPVRHNALLVRSDLVKHLSTSKVFTWVSGLGATAMGRSPSRLVRSQTDVPSRYRMAERHDLDSPIQRCCLSAARPVDAVESRLRPFRGRRPLLERAAHSIPYSLLPQVEPSAVGRSGAKGGEELLPDQDRHNRRCTTRGRGAFADRTAAETEASEGRLISTSGASDSSRQWSFAEGVDPNARIGVRFAVLADKELRQEAKKSEWYAKHGRNAGKERAAGGRANRADRYEEMYSWQDGANGGGGDDDGSAAATEGREFRKRIGRERRPDRRDDGPRSARGGGGGGRRTAEDLDSSSNGWLAGASGKIKVCRRTKARTPAGWTWMRPVIQPGGAGTAVVLSATGGKAREEGTDDVLPEAKTISTGVSAEQQGIRSELIER